MTDNPLLEQMPYSSILPTEMTADDLLESENPPCPWTIPVIGSLDRGKLFDS